VSHTVADVEASKLQVLHPGIKTAHLWQNVIPKSSTDYTEPWGQDKATPLSGKHFFETVSNTSPNRQFEHVSMPFKKEHVPHPSEHLEHGTADGLFWS